MLIDRLRRGLHDEDIRAAHVLEQLQVDLTIRETRQVDLPAMHAEEITDLLGERLIGGAAEDLQLVIVPRTLRLLLLWLFLLARRLVLFGLMQRFVGRSRHVFLLPNKNQVLYFLGPRSTTVLLMLLLRSNFKLAGRLGFEPRQSAPKALDLPLVDRPVTRFQVSGCTFQVGFVKRET